MAGAPAERRLHELYRLVLENVRDLITLFDEGGRILYASPSHRHTLGFDPDELVGQELGSFVHPDDLGTLLAERRAALATSRGELESIRVRHADGGWVTLEGTASAALGEDGRRLLLTTARDVGAQREAEAALRESRDLLEAVLGGVEDGITVLSPDGSFVYANRRGLELMGVESLDDLRDRPADEIAGAFEIYGTDSEPLPVERLPGRRVLHGEASAEEEVVYRTPGGEQRTSVVRALPVRSPDGTPRLAISVFRDVTAERRAERQLRFFAAASALLGSSLDYEATLRDLAGLVVPELADWYLADLLDGGAPRRVAVGHADPAQAALGWRLSKLAVRPEAEAVAVETGEAVLLEEVADELLVATFGHDEEALEEARGLGLRSLLFVPLVSRRRSLGSITLATAGARRLGLDDLRLAEELARRAAAAVDSARLFAETRETAALLDLLFGSAPVGFAFLDRELRFVRVNDALAELNGLPAAEHLGRSLLELLPDLDEEVFAAYDRALVEGEPTLGLELRASAQAGGGEERTFRASVYPVRDAAGDVLGAGVVVTDETERVELLEREQQARADAEAAAQSLRALESISKAALEHLSLDDLLNELLGRLVELMQADEAAILLLDESGAALVLRATTGFEPDELAQAVPVPVGEGMAGRVAATRTTAVFRELADVQLASPHLRLRGVHSLVAVPLVAAGKTLGVLHVGTLEPGRFGHADARLLELVADRIALAIVQSTLYEAEHAARTAAQEAQERLAFLAEASDVLASSLDYGATLSSLARLAVPRLADWCAIDVLAPDGTAERLAVAHADPDRVALAEELHRLYPPSPDDETGPYRVLGSGEPVLVPEISDELLAEGLAGRPEYLDALGELGLRSAMLVPLVSRGRTLGVISLIWAESDRRYGQADLVFAQELARRAATAVDNALLFRDAEERGQAGRILQSVGDGVFLVDGTGVLRYWNRAAEAVTGLDAAAVLDRPAAEAIPGWTTIAPLVSIGGAPQSMPLQLADRELWLSVSGVPVEDGTVYAFRDLTEDRALEELRTEFVSTVSHELRTPLAAIYGAAMTLRRDDVQLEESQREGLLAVVTGEADRLARIVNDILWASRLDSDSLHVAIESCDGAALAAAVVEAQRAHLPEGIEVVLDAASGPPPVAADPDKVRQVLVNLVDNAVKYSPDGGRVALQVEAHAAHVRFAVSDEGLGIPYAEQRRIFDKFYRLDPNLTRGVGGTGLGLYICRELVRRMHGRIWVESSPGRGSTFSVELPVADGEDGVVAHLAAY